MPLLVKYIFTSEYLSVQVHPNDQQARERGLSAGKTECWYILDAEPGARLGLGLLEPMDADELRAAALDGSIEQLMLWKPVKPGDVFFVPAGTVHAIGAGLTLIEVQQNSDVTYRLYDYGRPRELHLDDGIAVALGEPYLFPPISGLTHGNQVLVWDSHFSLFTVDDMPALRKTFETSECWVMPLSGLVTSAGHSAGRGECLWLDPGAEVTMTEGGRALVAISRQGDLS